MELTTLLLSMAAMGGLGFAFSAGLSVANKKLHVEEDPRIAMILDLLPGANCGGCGYAGCSNFAENVVTGKTQIGGCPVCTESAAQQIGNIMGIEVDSSDRMLARIMCQGGIHETAQKAIYSGIKSCIGASMVSGGEKLCEYGCIGFGDCVEECQFDAMYMNENGLPVVIEEKCTGCGNCVKVCPRGVIELHSEAHKLFVLCRNHDNPKDSRKVCTKACLGCGICARATEEGHMFMDDNLAKIDYTLYGEEGQLPTDKCSTGCLVVIDKQQAQVAEV